MEINPFAPTFVGVENAVGRTELSISYWVGFTVLLIVSFSVVLGFPIGWLGVATTIAAAIRVPLLQRRHTRMQSGFNLPTGFALLFTSLALMLVFVVVSFIAFAAVCIPGSIAFSMGNLGSWIFWFSVAASLICFCTLFVLSLRLRF